MATLDLGQVMGPPGPQGERGPAGEAGRDANRNLLMNWYFADPINQRGKTKYTAPGYTIDRYRLEVGAEAEVVVGESGITISAKERDCVLAQHMDPLLAKKLVGQTLTVSALTTDGSIFSATGVFQIGVTGQIVVWTPYGPISCTPAGENYIQAIRIVVSAGKSISLRAAKLELGDHQTLAHREGDKWVLNDPPPDPALELARCQRYYFRAASDWVGQYTTGNGTLLGIRVPLPVAMRANPSARVTGDFRLDGGATFTLSHQGTGTATANGVVIGGVETDYDFASYNSGALLPLGSDSVIELDAEL